MPKIDNTISLLCTCQQLRWKVSGIPEERMNLQTLKGIFSCSHSFSFATMGIPVPFKRTRVHLYTGHNMYGELFVISHVSGISCFPSCLDVFVHV